MYVMIAVIGRLPSVLVTVSKINNRTGEFRDKQKKDWSHLSGKDKM